jgi:hypothetical protein
MKKFEDSLGLVVVAGLMAVVVSPAMAVPKWILRKKRKRYICEWSL